MNHKKIIETDKSTRFSTYLILFIFLFYFFQMFGQTASDSTSQLQRMKENYQQWLLKMIENELQVEYDLSPVALDIPKPRFTRIDHLEGRERLQIKLPIFFYLNMQVFFKNGQKI